jgi:hypothetical protein
MDSDRSEKPWPRVTRSQLEPRHQSISSAANLVDSLERNIRREEWPACCLQDYANQSSLQHLLAKSKTLRWTIRRLNLAAIKILSGIHHLNLEYPVDTGKPSVQEKWARFLNDIVGLRRTRGQWCMSLVLAVQIWLTIRFGTILYYQYPYDFDRLRLKRLVAKQTNATSPSAAAANNDAYRRQLELRLAGTREALREIGAPHMEWGMVTEFAYTYFLQAALFTLVVVPLYFNFHRCAYFPWARYFLDAKAERRAQAEWIVEQIDDYIKSSRAYTRSRLELIMRSLPPGRRAEILAELDAGGGESPTRLAPNNGDRNWQDRWPADSPDDDELADQQLRMLSWAIDKPDSRLLYHRHGSRCRQALQLALNGRLNPLVDRSDGWLDKLALLNISIFCVIMCYSVACMTFLYVEFGKHFDSMGRHMQCNTMRERLTLMGTYWGQQIVFASTAFLFNLSYLSFLDLIRTLYLLRETICQTIKRNQVAFQLLGDILAIMAPHERKLLAVSRYLRTDRQSRNSDSPLVGCRRMSDFGSLTTKHNSLALGTHDNDDGCRPAGQSAENQRRALDLIETIETDTAAALLHYKYFCAEFERLRAGYKMFAFIILYVPGSLPPLIRLNMPYMDDTRARLFMVATSMAAAPSFCLAWPYCYIHRRCLDVNKALASLLAQLVLFESADLTRDCLNLDHLTSVLRKQLRRADLFSRRFAIRLVGLIDLTYPNVLRIQFWISLITISMLVDISPALNSLTDDLLADPFGVF